MALYRSLALPLVVLAVLVVFAGAGCSGDEDTTPTPVTTSRPGAATSTSIASTTTGAVTASTTTTVAAPPSTPSTKPLTTAPPSPLLDQVVAAYDAAYADLLAAEFALDENHPALPNHIAGELLTTVRERIRGMVADGVSVREISAAPEWRRVERLTPVSDSLVRIEVCRLQRQETVENGVGTGADSRAFRYSETLERVGGSWKWTGREWIDSKAEGSDCSLQ